MSVVKRDHCHHCEDNCGDDNTPEGWPFWHTDGVAFWRPGCCLFCRAEAT